MVFTLKEPFASFPINLVMPIVPDGAGPSLREHPMGTGPYRFVRYAVDDRIELEPFNEYFGGRPRNDGLVLEGRARRHHARASSCAKARWTSSSTTSRRTSSTSSKRRPTLQVVESPGVDYQYIGLNLRDPILKDVRVRQALGYAIDRQAIVEYLRRGLATPATGLLPPLSWAFARRVLVPARSDAARALLDEAGYRDPDGDGPAPRLRLSLKISNARSSTGCRRR